MSGGYLTDHDYSEQRLCQNLFGWDIDCHYGIGKYKEYNDSVKKVRKLNPMKNVFVSELVYDVLCLIHSCDYYVSGYAGSDTYDADIKAFAEKWLKKPNEELMKQVVDESVEDLREDLYVALGLKKREHGEE